MSPHPMMVYEKRSPDTKKASTVLNTTISAVSSSVFTTRVSQAGLIICKTPHLLAIDRYDACEERSIYFRNATVYGCPQSSDVWLCVTKLTASSFC